MVKNLRFIFVSMLMLICGTVSAQTVFDFDANGKDLFGLPGESNNDGGTDGNITEAKTATIDSYSVTVSAANEGVSNANRIWNASPKLRMYSGTLTISSANANMKSIVFTLASQSSKAKWGAGNTANVGTLDASAKTSATWTGDANEVVITIAANTQISKITISSDGGEVTPPAPQVKSVGVAEALSIIDALADGATTTDIYQVKGFVVGNPDFKRNASGALYGDVNLNIADTKGGSTTLAIYRGKNFKNEAFTEDNLESIKADDEVIFEGQLKKYVKDEEVTPEMTNCYLISVNGKTEGEEKPVEVTAAASIALFNALSDGTVAELTLNNAQVLFANATDIFVRDNTGAVDFYRTDLALKAGQIMNGSVIGKKAVYNGMNELTKTDNTNAEKITLTDGTATPKEIGLDEVAGFACDLVIVKNVTLVQEDGKWYATNEDGDRVQVYDKFKISYTPEAEKAFDITGIVIPYNDTFEIAPINDFTGAEEVPATPVASVEALLAMVNTNNIDLTLTNAKVLFVDNNYIYVRENGKAICFYQINGLKEVAKNNSVINGHINADYEVYKLMPELKSNKNTNLEGLTIVESEEEAEPVATTLAEVAQGKYVCDLVTLTATLVKEVTYKEDGVTVQSTTYKLKEGDTELVVINNSKGLNKIDEGTEITVTGIVNTSNNAYQVKLTKNVSTEGISIVVADNGQDTVYNLNGQRVVKAQKGLYIIGGKKVMVK